MTTPAPFPPELETAITDALERHQSVVAALRYAATYRCTGCKEDSGSPLRTTAKAWLRNHQAAVVMETIAQHTTTEWGVRWEGSSDVDMTGHESTSREFVRQGADHGFVDVAVARLVLPWQELKA
ncbi:hypothetical protein [Arthrobacter woluwensis]|uniref:Uncharacterized protein n=1 Tax=Arthrobacter woluwensis TaxID=156980 RepID=A0A1H4WT93_9MICC|nr:hypothetical protein [Arthrobacter woluwensis]SEC89653.1 hypothetical protein SAMN04489745_3451 [Arthrobacter woluwensis]SEC95948.1 hypothetical protein SAMN04489745_3553 [Arthrobacter woluwensis]